MTDNLGSRSQSPGAPKRRSTRACQSCRRVKTKCESVAGQSRCRRCIATSASCLFLASRRGRIRGSKNRQTLEKLRHGQVASEASGSADAGLRTESSASPGDENPPDLRCDDTTAPTPGRSGATTPWNPHRLVMHSEGGHPHRPTLARKLLHILGEFPVEESRSDDGASETRGPQDPLWLIAGLAERGWDLNGVREGGGAGAQPTVPGRPTVLAGPAGGLPAEDTRLLGKWTAQALQGIKKEQSRYFEHGVLGSKFDVAHDLDPVQHGLLNEEKAGHLFGVYWDMIHPQWAILDPTLHTLDYVRSRSALLTTTILALASTALAMLPPRQDEQTAEALRLHAHAEKLNLVVYTTGARSIDITQAHILLCRWGASPRTRLDEQRWIRAGMIPRMASEIGLNIPRRYGDNYDKEEADRLRRNDLRTRAFIIINDFFTYSGRQATDLAQFELSDAELNDISQPGGRRYFSSAAALYRLFLFDRDVRRRLDRYQPGAQCHVSLDAELEHIKSYVERWISDWCPRDGDPHLNWHLSHDGLSCWLLLAVSIARKRLQQLQDQQQYQQQLLLSLSTRLFKEALRVPEAVLTTHRASILPFAASIMLGLGGRRDLILRTALRMAGEPGKPYVPTFVRESGNQMLVMLLCTNSLRSMPPEPVDGEMPSDTGQVQSEEATMHDQVDQEVPDGNSSQYFEEPAATTPFGPRVASPGSINNMLVFDLADFPCATDPAQPQPQPYQASALPPYDTFDLDFWIPPMARNECLPGNCDSTAAAAAAAAAHVPFFHPGVPLDGTTPYRAHDDGASWSLDGPSPADITMTNSGRNAQREALLAAVDRLIELATLMQ